MTFSIKTLLLITAFCAVAVVLLLNPTKLTEVIACTLTLGALIAGTLYWVSHGNNTPLHFRTAICVSWIYISLIWGPFQSIEDSLATTALIKVINPLLKVQPPPVDFPAVDSFSLNGLPNDGNRNMYFSSIGHCIWIWIIAFTTAVIVKILTKDKNKVPA